MSGSLLTPMSRALPATMRDSGIMSKVALVTRAGRGIGRACAIALARKGFDIAIVDLTQTA